MPMSGKFAMAFEEQRKNTEVLRNFSFRLWEVAQDGSREVLKVGFSKLCKTAG